MVFSLPANAAELRGTVSHVRDGDTIEVENIPIRLQGVSAPKLDETLGQASKLFMRDLVLGQSVVCQLNGETTHDRFVGVCYLESKDIAVDLIQAGLAIDCPKFSNGMYANYQTAQARTIINLPSYCRKE